MAVKEAGADCVMTSYGSVNGTWTAGSYDLNTVILREEWGFKGMVMTDWWAEINDEEHQEPVRRILQRCFGQNGLHLKSISFHYQKPLEEVTDLEGYMRC